MERARFELELLELGLRSAPRIPRVSVARAAVPTIGFEFDLNVGIQDDVFTARSADMPAGSVFPPEHDPLTGHVGRDGSGALADGFEVKRDGPRLEIATVPIEVGDDQTFDEVLANVVKFAKELETRRKAVKADRGITVAGISGHPVVFTHRSTLISKLPLVIAPRGKRSALKWPGDTTVWASPQATVTLPLARVPELITAVVRSSGDGKGKALTGTKSQRLGVRSLIAARAMHRVMEDRKKRLGTTLSDGSQVTENDYTLGLAGLVMLMTSYLLCGEILDARDYEGFAKGYLPLNVKAPFREIFHGALTDRERLVFRELYYDRPENFFALARPGATAADGDREIFPANAQGDLDRFHAVIPTWRMLLVYTVMNLPLLVTKPNTVRKKKHALGDEVLWAPLSSIIAFKKTSPLVAIELRRIGYAAHGVTHWPVLMKTVRKLAQRLNR